MKTLFFLFGVLLSSDFASAEATNAAASPATPPVAVSAMPVYHPPNVSGGVLPIRVGGGSRGGAGNGVTVEVLVPDQIALTAQEQPSLYWYQSKAAKTRCEVTLTQPKKAKPLLVLQSTGATAAGIHALKLADHKIKLEPKVVYKWSVALVTDPKNRSEDIIANGVIEYVPASPDLTAKLATADASQASAIYAGAGYWYDALNALSAAIEKNPSEASLQTARASLLTQVGLDGARIEKTAFKQ